MSLLARGFVQIAPRSLGQEAELLFSFSTSNHSGVLLSAFSDDRTQRQVRQVRLVRQTDRGHLYTNYCCYSYHYVTMIVFCVCVQHFLSVHLVSGVVEAELGEVGGATRRVMVVKPNGGSFSDGTKHSVIITINRK